jgi:hypothetical protein
MEEERVCAWVVRSDPTRAKVPVSFVPVETEGEAGQGRVPRGQKSYAPCSKKRRGEGLEVIDYDLDFGTWQD